MTSYQMGRVGKGEDVFAEPPCCVGGVPFLCRQRRVTQDLTAPGRSAQRTQHAPGLGRDPPFSIRSRVFFLRFRESSLTFTPAEAIK